MSLARESGDPLARGSDGVFEPHLREGSMPHDAGANQGKSDGLSKAHGTYEVGEDAGNARRIDGGTDRGQWVSRCTYNGLDSERDNRRETATTATESSNKDHRAVD